MNEKKKQNKTKRNKSKTQRLAANQSIILNANGPLGNDTW